MTGKLQIAVVDQEGRLRHAGIHRLLNHDFGDIREVAPVDCLRHRYDAIVLDPDSLPGGFSSMFQYVAALRASESPNRSVPVVVMGRYFPQGDTHYRGLEQAFYAAGATRYVQIREAERDTMHRVITQARQRFHPE